MKAIISLYICCACVWIIEGAILFNSSLQFGNYLIGSLQLTAGESGSLIVSHSQTSNIAVYSSELQQTPSYSWGLAGKTPGRFSNVRDVAVSPTTGDVYVLDIADERRVDSYERCPSTPYSSWRALGDKLFRIQVFSPSGGKRKRVLTHPVFPSETQDQPAGKRKIIVKDSDLIVENTPPIAPPVVPNQLLPVLGATKLQIGINGNFYLLDKCKRRIVVFSSQGEILFEIGRCPPAREDYESFVCPQEDTTLCGPLEFSISSEGLVYVLDSRKCANRQSYEHFFSSRTLSPQHDRQGNAILDFLADYRIMVFDAATGEFKVKRLFRRGYGSGEFGDRLGSIALDSKGNLYVSDTDNDRVQVFNTSLQFVSEFGYAGHGNGQFDTPTQLAASGNALFVRDRRSESRIQKFVLD